LEPGKISQITPVDRGAPVMSMSLEKAEITMLTSALEQTDWNQTRAAQILGVTRDTLRYKMKKFGLRHTKNPLQQAKRSAG
jgi:DNA-binding NtrC family response regulator